MPLNRVSANNTGESPGLPIRPDPTGNPENTLGKIARTIFANNPSKSTFSKLLTHVWVWIKQGAATFWNWILGERNPNFSTETVYIKTLDGYLYHVAIFDRELLDRLRSSFGVRVEKGAIKVQNPQAFLAYVDFQKHKRLDANPRHDSALHSGNVLQILETAQDLEDAAAIAYCSKFLETLVTERNQADFLRLAIEYQLSDLESFISAKSFSVPEREAQDRSRLVFNRIVETEDPSALADVLDQVIQSGSVSVWRSEVFAALEARNSCPTTLEDLKKGRNTRWDLDTFRTGILRVIFNSIRNKSVLTSEEMALLAQIAVYMPSNSIALVKQLFSGDLNCKERLALLPVIKTAMQEFQACRGYEESQTRALSILEGEFNTIFSNKSPKSQEELTYLAKVQQQLINYNVDAYVELVMQASTVASEEVKRKIHAAIKNNQGVEEIYVILGLEKYQRGIYSVSDYLFGLVNPPIRPLSESEMVVWAQAKTLLGECEQSHSLLLKIDQLFRPSKNSEFEAACEACAGQFVELYQQLNPSTQQPSNQNAQPAAGYFGITNTVVKICQSFWGFGNKQPPNKGKDEPVLQRPDYLLKALDLYFLALRQKESASLQAEFAKERILPAYRLLYAQDRKGLWITLLEKGDLYKVPTQSELAVIFYLEAAKTIDTVDCLEKYDEVNLIRKTVLCTKQAYEQNPGRREACIAYMQELLEEIGDVKSNSGLSTDPRTGKTVRDKDLYQMLSVSKEHLRNGQTIDKFEFNKDVGATVHFLLAELWALSADPPKKKILQHYEAARDLSPNPFGALALWAIDDQKSEAEIDDLIVSARAMAIEWGGARMKEVILAAAV